MHREGHYGASLLAYAPLLFGAMALGFPTAGVGGAVLALALAMVPDWDQQMPGVAHRGVTHTVHFAGAVAVVTALLGAGMGATASDGNALVVIGGAVFGGAAGALAILGHIGADALTPMGVDPLGEDGPHISYGVCRADNQLGNYALLALGIAGGLVAFYAGRGVNTALGV
ncbi:metal-dependent hydrolase [Haloarcula laminariae]|uniref:metal-dependent hydrolase n=1 Tax=Haloarcula laminariae TaxID=2961577 RepID=UPI0021C6B7EF|nr:metal-dependent hydrolase [Halomicroarcula laminariae]